MDTTEIVIMSSRMNTYGDPFLFQVLCIAYSVYINPCCSILYTKKKKILYVFDLRPNSVWSKRAKFESMNPSLKEKDIGSLWEMAIDNVEAISWVGAVVIWYVYTWRYWVIPGKEPRFRFVALLSVLYHVQENEWVSSSQPPLLCHGV